MTPEEIAAQKAKEKEAADAAAAKAKEDSQGDPIKEELKKIEEKKLTKKQRLEFAKRKIEEQLSEMNDGTVVPIDTDKDKPVTVAMLEQREKEAAKKTALELAEAIEDSNERELTIHYLTERIVSSGNPEEDVKFARSAVNALRNAKIAEEMARKKSPKAGSSAPGAPIKAETAFEPTPDELVFMRPPYNLSKEKILEARKAEAKE